MSIVLSEYYGLTPDIYVGPSGDDLNNGLIEGSPKATISGTGGAIDNTSAGDVIGLLDGTYTYVEDDFDMNADRTFVGKSFGGVKIDANALVSNPDGYHDCGVAGVSVDIINLWFSNYLLPVSGAGARTPNFNILSDSSGLVIFNQCLFNNQGLSEYSTGDGTAGALIGPKTFVAGKVKTINCIMWGIHAAEDIGDTCQIFGDYQAEDGRIFDYENIGLTVILTATGASSIDGIFGSTGTSTTKPNYTAKNRNCVIANYSGVVIDLFASTDPDDMDTDNSFYYNISNTNTLGANDSTSDPKLIDPEFDNLTDPDDWKLAFKPQANSPAIGAGVAT